MRLLRSTERWQQGCLKPSRQQNREYLIATALRNRRKIRCAHCLRAVFFPVHDLFSEQEEDVDLTKVESGAPLATRMRPRTLEEFVGQEHILAPGKLLRRAIEADRLPSVILSGPPGTGTAAIPVKTGIPLSSALPDTVV